MLLYVFVAVFPLLVWCVYFKMVEEVTPIQKKQTKRYINKRFWWLMLAALPMFMLIGLRHSSMGADTGSYQSFFERIQFLTWEESLEFEELEVGFLIFQKSLTYVTSSPFVYQCIYAGIYMLSVVSFANRMKSENFSYLYFFATIGIYTFMFTGVRQCLAMCICLFSYRFVQNRRIIKFVICVLLAFTFHKSAMLFIVVYFIYNRKLNVLNTLVYTVIGALCFFNIDLVQEWFNDQLDYDYGVEATEGGYVFTIVIAVITIFAVVMILNYKKLDVESRGMINVGFVALIFWVVRIATRVAERPSYYFLFFSIAMLCYGMDSPSKSNERLLYRILIYGVMMALFVYRMSTNFANLVPYKVYA